MTGAEMIIEEAISSKGELIGWRIRVGKYVALIYKDQTSTPGIRLPSGEGFVPARGETIRYEDVYVRLVRYGNGFDL